MKALVSFLLMTGVVVSYILMTNETDIELSSRSPASIPANYETMKACQKQDVLWKRVEDSAYKEGEYPDFRKFGALQLFSMGLQELTKKGSLQSDFAPEGWKKYIHRHGSLAKVKFVATSDKYTGLFKGAECGLLRLSLTYRPSGSKPVAPGLALKLLRDGQASSNVSALVSLEGQGQDYNIFKYPMSNIVQVSSAFGQKMVHKVFSRYSSRPEELLVNDFASVDERGQKSSLAKAPRQLFFVPSKDLKFNSDEHDMRDDLKTIRAGTTVYEIRAVSEIHKDFDYAHYDQGKLESFLETSEHVADVITTSDFVASSFGDDGLFFRHEIHSK